MRTDDYTQTEAWAAGVAQAERALALQPPDDGTLGVTLNRYPERVTYKLCRQCHHERGSRFCPH